MFSLLPVLIISMVQISSVLLSQTLPKSLASSSILIETMPGTHTMPIMCFTHPVLTCYLAPFVSFLELL